MTESLQTYAIVWAACFGALSLFAPSSRGFGAGLTIAYGVNFSVNHFFGALNYVLSDHVTSDPEVVMLGFAESTVGMFAFTFGAIVISRVAIAVARPSWARITPRIPDARLPRAYIMTGFVFYFLLLPFIKNIPSVATLGFSGWSLMILGLCLAARDSWIHGRGKRLMRWLIASLFFPFVTMVYQGFLGYGISAMIIVLSFVSVFYRPKWKFAAASLVTAYIGLSFFVTYFRDREELREAVWYERQSLSERVEKVTNMITNFEWYNPGNDLQARRIDLRLNQNIQVGQAILHIGMGHESFARGETLATAAVSFIPRILWPGKPVVGGSGDYVSIYTGEEFAEGTSVGMGQVFEFYINFGRTCVIAGFLILGAFIAFVDAAAAHRLRIGDLHGATRWFLPGMGLLQAGGSLMEVVSTFVAAIVFCEVVNKYVLPRMSGRTVSMRDWLKSVIVRRKVRA